MKQKLFSSFFLLSFSCVLFSLIATFLVSFLSESFFFSLSFAGSTSIAVFRIVDDVIVSVSSSSGGVGGRGGNEKSGDCGTNSAGSGNRLLVMLSLSVSYSVSSLT